MNKSSVIFENVTEAQEKAFAKNVLRQLGNRRPTAENIMSAVAEWNAKVEAMTIQALSNPDALARVVGPMVWESVNAGSR